MKTANLFWLFSLISALTLLNVNPGRGQTLTAGQPDKLGASGPVITRAYAVEKGRYGDSLKIYVEADDPNGEMLRIATEVDQTGYGHYPTDWTYLKPQYQHHFVGYLQWNTFSPNAPRIREWTQITIEVSVFDKAGRQSNEVIIPFEFVSEAVSHPQPPAPFDSGKVTLLGHIDINLFEPTEMGGGREVEMRLSR